VTAGVGNCARQIYTGPETRNLSFVGKMSDEKKTKGSAGSRDLERHYQSLLDGAPIGKGEKDIRITQKRLHQAVPGGQTEIRNVQALKEIILN